MAITMWHSIKKTNTANGAGVNHDNTHKDGSAMANATSPWQKSMQQWAAAAHLSFG